MYPDTNGLHNNVALSNAAGLLLAAELEEDGVVLRFSPVVLAEMQRQETDDLEVTRKQLDSTIMRALKGTLIDDRMIRAAAMTTMEQLEDGIKAKYSEVIARSYVEVDYWPDTSAREMVERELERRRPF